MGRDVIVTDENFQLASQVIKSYGDFLYEKFVEYEWILIQVSYQAIQDSFIDGVLQKISENFPEIRREMEDAVHTIGEYAISFLEEIDEADQFLYENATIKKEKG
ncbi:MAG: hypothetical protein SO016_11560 [Lachnospiraceae bacterium]|nr:hypothetical protein [Robinsoniella sp.]MDY3767302.1 hypothetical protein [Lachnospiraceae bacterium]